MSIIKFTNLSEIKPFKNGWTVQVKILHSWKQFTAQTGETLEVVLADQDGIKIHATCKKAYISRLARHLIVGEWKIIQNFGLSPASGQYRSTNHLYKMSFVNNTSITPSAITSDDNFISIVDFDTILSGTLKTWFLIDVIGQILDVGDIQTVQCAGKEKKKVEFTLRDINDQRIACCLWGKFAETVCSAFEEPTGGIVVCLIRFAKIGKYRLNLQISNAFDASQVIINPETSETESLRQMFGDTNGALVLSGDPQEDGDKVVKRDPWFQYQEMSITDMLNYNEATKCKITCTIYAIDKVWGWYYFGCCVCNKKCTKVGEMPKKKPNEKAIPIWFCDTCDGNVPYANHRFKLHLMVKDDSSCTKFMLLDTPAKQIVTKSAATLLNGSFEELEDPDALPYEIESLVGKTFIFGVCNEKENFQYGNETYKAILVGTLDNLSPNNSVTIQDSLSKEENTIISGSEDSLLLTDSQGNSEMLTTPSSKRSQEEADVAPDLTSTSKKPCTKAIKLEKMDEEKLKNN